MEKRVYKVDCFGCLFSTKKKYHEQSQECIDRNAAEGWLLQHWEIAPMGEWCTVVFYKNVEN